MTALTDLTMAAARDGLAKKEFSARELAEAHIAAVEAMRPLNAALQKHRPKEEMFQPVWDKSV